MLVQPYLCYEGRCEEAVEFYKGALGATVIMMMRFRDSPDQSMCPTGQKEKIMHASLRIGESVIMASDGRCDAVELVLVPWAEKVTDPQCWFGDRAAPALVRWVAWLDGRGWIPPAFPKVLIDLFLAHPEADVSSYDCEECGLTMPSESSRTTGNDWTKAYPYLQACPHCSGRIAYNGYFNKHRQTSRVD